jgi:adenine-specific DNA-methyltransferase
VQFLTGKRYAKKGSKYAEQVISEPNWQMIAIFGKDEKAEKQARDFVKRMMGRIVFLYFIQKKGWLAVAKGKTWGEGNPDYLFDLFKKSKQKDDFYARELVPLFFSRLNNEDSENIARDERFPYLNGGLFDDTQDRKYNKLHLPEDVFEKMFDTFNNYNFTIYEDAPDEHTVAVDPEMLGHIFENLLEDNKDKGAFYTPKEIVHYMCKESLKAYLFAQDEKQYADELAKATIDKIIQQQELNEDETKFAEKNAYKIIDALESVKICDPAIGSGAFPMGLLQEIFNAQIYLQELKGFKKAKTDADIKKHIIEESIYGVDIDAGAVDIARLRFWLSLVVDEQEPQPLPNLDFKIICANTLIPLGQLNGLDMDAKASLAVKELEKIRHDFFNVSSESKLALERKFKKVQTDLLSLRELTTKDNYEFYTKLYGFNPFDFEAAPCSWFDAWWMFGVKDGFDIVIGNPPYVQLQKDGGNLAKLYQTYKYDTFERTGDIYSLFYERGVQLLNDKGILCYITSNKWMRANYGASTRQFFAEKTYPLLLIDFGSIQVFETATVDTNILLLQNKPKAKSYDIKQTFAVSFTKDFDLANQNINDYITENGYYLTSLNQNSWVVGARDIYNIKEFVEHQGIELRLWDLSINYGIKTGLTEAYIIDEITKNNIISKDPKSKEIIRPVLKGRDISAWYPNLEKQFIIFAHNGSKRENINPINIERDYFGAYEWLKQFEVKLKARQDQGDNWYNLRSCAYLNEFEKEKIIYREITQKFDFCYDSGEILFIDTAWMMVGKQLKYLTVFFNSKLFNYCFRDNFTDLGSGGRRLKKVFFEKIPVKQITNEQEIPFAKMVAYLVALKKENSQETSDQFMFIYFEQVANALVFELYYKEEFESRNLAIAEYINQLPNINESENITHQLRKIYVSINQDKHPIKAAIFNMLAIPQVELIMNSN